MTLPRPFSRNPKPRCRSFSEFLMRRTPIFYPFPDVSKPTFWVRLFLVPCGTTSINNYRPSGVPWLKSDAYQIRYHQLVVPVPLLSFRMFLMVWYKLIWLSATFGQILRSLTLKPADFFEAIAMKGQFAGHSNGWWQDLPHQFNQSMSSLVVRPPFIAQFLDFLMLKARTAVGYSMIFIFHWYSILYPFLALLLARSLFVTEIRSSSSFC
jgi:hypothetical protein